MQIRSSGVAGLSRMLICGVAAAVIVSPLAVQAQEDNAANDESDAAEGNMIIVTATKRETTLQETPVAVSVTTAETLARENIRDLNDLQVVVPSLRVSQLQSSANTNFIIRGFGNGANNAGIEPSVGVFVDGVYRSRTASQISDLPDISRIEVLRGPQSTLFGKNASAGVISLITREPSFDTTGSFDLSVGNYNAVVARGYVSTGLSDQFAASLAGGINMRQGYNRDLGSDTRTNQRDRYFVRGQLLFDNGSDFKVRVIGDYDKINENCCGVVNLQSSPATAAIVALGGQVSNPADPFANVVYNNFPSTNAVKNYGISGQIDYDLGNVALTSITSLRRNRGAYGQDVDFTSLDLLQRFQDQRLNTFTQELRATGQFGPVSVLAGAFFFDESVIENQTVNKGSSFRDFADLSLGGDGSGAAVTFLEGTIGTLYNDPTQYLGQFFTPSLAETGSFQLDNRALSLFGQFDFEIADGLVLTVGGNYTTDKKTAVTNYASSDVFSGIDLVDAGSRAIYAQGVAVGAGTALMLDRPATQAEIADLINNIGLAAFNQLIASPAQAYAAANATNPDVNPLLAAQALQLFPNFLNIPNVVEAGKTKDNDFSYTVRLAYDVSPDMNVYASYATGFKASSFNLSRDSRPTLADAAAIETANLTQVNQTYGSRFASPEHAKVMEVGFKGNWGDYSVNLTGFRQDINGFQSNVFTGTGFFLANAGKQRTYGVELESVAHPIEPLTLNLAVTWLDPSFVSFPLSPVGDLSGDRPAGISTWTVVLGGQYEYELGNGDTIVASASYHYESKTNIVEGLPGFLPLGQAAAIAAADQFSRQVDDVSASLAYNVYDLDLQLSIWGRNLLNDRYLQSIFDSPAQQFSISGYPNTPRTYGVAARFSF